MSFEKKILPLSAKWTFYAIIRLISVMTELDLERVFKKYFKPLYVYAMQILQDEEKSKDMVADTFEYVCLHAMSIDESTVHSLLYATLRSRCLDLLRHDKVRQRYADYYRIVTSHETDNHYEDHEERCRRINEGLQALQPRTRAILEACYVEKKKYKEAAQEFGITEHGIRKQIYKALHQLKQHIKKNE